MRNTELLDWLHTTLDCGDNSCMFRDHTKPSGMRTNGGCCCFDGLSRTKRQFVHKMFHTLVKLETSVKENVNVEIKRDDKAMYLCSSIASADFEDGSYIELLYNLSGPMIIARCHNTAGKMVAQYTVSGHDIINVVSMLDTVEDEKEGNKNARTRNRPT